MPVRIEAYLSLERSLVDRLTQAWLKMAKGVVPSIIAALREKDYAKAEELIANLDLEPLFEENREYVRYITLSAMLFGASRLTPEVRRTVVARIGSNEVVEAAVESLRASVMGYVEDSIRALLMDLVAGLSLADEATPLSEGDTTLVEKAARIVNPFVSFRNQAETEAAATLQLAASLHTSRLSAFGFTAEADVLNVSEYTISAQLDNRVCPICEYMDGKVFRVADARASLNEILREKDPEAMKTLQPWPAQDEESVAEFQSLSDEELVDRNWHIPPFHPGCRCLLVHTDSVPKITDTPSYIAAIGGGTTVEAAAVAAAAEEVARREAALLSVEQSSVGYVVGQQDSAGREYGMAFNPTTGDVLKQWRGDRNSISFNSPVDGPLLKDARFIHNHPSSFSLSLADFRMTGHYGMDSIVAVGMDTSKYIGRAAFVPAAMQVRYGTFMENLQAASQVINNNELGPAVRAGTVTSDEAMRFFTHLQNDVLREVGVVSYSMEVKGPLVSDAIEKVSKVVNVAALRKQLKDEFDAIVGGLTADEAEMLLWA